MARKKNRDVSGYRKGLKKYWSIHKALYLARYPGEGRVYQKYALSHYNQLIDRQPYIASTQKNPGTFASGPALPWLCRLPTVLRRHIVRLALDKIHNNYENEDEPLANAQSLVSHFNSGWDRPHIAGLLWADFRAVVQVYVPPKPTIFISIGPNIVRSYEVSWLTRNVFYEQKATLPGGLWAPIDATVHPPTEVPAPILPHQWQAWYRGLHPDLVNIGELSILPQEPLFSTILQDVHDNTNQIATARPKPLPSLNDLTDLRIVIEDEYQVPNIAIQDRAEQYVYHLEALIIALEAARPLGASSTLRYLKICMKGQDPGRVGPNWRVMEQNGINAAFRGYILDRAVTDISGHWAALRRMDLDILCPGRRWSLTCTRNGPGNFNVVTRPVLSPPTVL